MELFSNTEEEEITVTVRNAQACVNVGLSVWETKSVFHVSKNLKSKPKSKSPHHIICTFFVW